MKSLSITTAWNETSAFVAREARLLLPVSLALIALPSVLLQALTRGIDPADMSALGLSLLLLVPLVICLSLLGTLTISILALRPGTVVGDAIKAAAQRLLPVLGAALLLGLAAAIVLTPLVLAFDPRRGGHGNPLIGLFVFPLALLFVFLSVRMMMINPAAADSNDGPLALMRRSWALTAGHFWKLFGFTLLLVILFLVVTMAVTAVLGIVIVLVMGSPRPGGAAFLPVVLLNAILNSVFVVYFTSMVARIYVQLAGGSRSGGTRDASSGL